MQWNPAQRRRIDQVSFLAYILQLVGHKNLVQCLG